MQSSACLRQLSQRPRLTGPGDGLVRPGEFVVQPVSHPPVEAAERSLQPRWIQWLRRLTHPQTSPRRGATNSASRKIAVQTSTMAAPEATLT